MGKPEAPKDDAACSADKTSVKQNGMNERRQAIEEYIRSLREFLNRLREKLHQLGHPVCASARGVRAIPLFEFTPVAPCGWFITFISDTVPDEGALPDLKSRRVPHAVLLEERVRGAAD